MTTRPTDPPTDQEWAEPEPDEVNELDEFEDPVAPRDARFLPSRRSPLPVPAHESLSAVFGECKRSGRWSAPDRISAEAWFGEVKLDFREAEIAADGVVEVKATAVFGQVTLVVPKGTEVELGGVSALFGEVGTKEGGKLRSMARRWLIGDDDEDYEDDPHELDEEPMLIRVKGNAVFGSIHVVLG